ncbi:MAG: IclR family transcriptional regulator [Oscillochloris sp.]|nr:IclR family transcriptional regulator [Oscillochloris sp.]
MVEHTLVPAVHRALTILALFEEQADWSLTEIHQRLEISKSTVHDLLATLQHHGYIERDSLSQRYHLGSTILNLARYVPNQPQLADLAQPWLNRIRDQVNETVFLGVYVDGHPTLQANAEARQMLKMSAPIGKRLPTYSGSFGKVYMASLSDEECVKLLTERPIRPFTDYTVTALPEILAEVARVRAQGYASDDQEYVADVWSTAAPIYRRGQLIAAILVAGIRTRMDEHIRKQATAGVIEATTAIMRQL